MSDILPPLVLALRANASQVYSEYGKVGAATKKLDSETEGGLSSSKKAFAGLAGAGKAVTLGIAGGAIAVGAASLKMGVDFQEATTQLVTGAGESEENIGMIQKGLENMAPAVGMGPEALAKAMFLVESAGFHGADGLKVMQAAAEGAKIGGADATVVANGLTTALSDYHLPAAQAADVTSKLVATVAAGKTNMADLSSSLSNVLPSAAAAGVGLDQVLGAMGTMTGQGISAAQASQDLAGTIRSLGNPSAVATKAMAQMGLNSTTVASQLGKKGLTGTLDELTTAITSHMGPAGLVLQSSFNQSKLAAQSAQTMIKGLPSSLQGLATSYLAGTVTQKAWTAALKDQPATVANLGKQFATVAKQSTGFADTLKSGSGPAKTYNAMLSDMTGGATGLNTSLALTGGNMKTFAANTDTISKATAEAGGHVKGWSDTSKDLSTQIAQAKAGVEALGTKIGIALIPYVEKAIKVGLSMTQWLEHNKPVAIALAIVIGGALVAATAAWAVSLFVAGGALAFLASPITLIVAAVALLAIGAIYAYTHFKTFRTVIDALGTGLKFVWNDVIKPVADFLMNHWKVALIVAVAVLMPFLLIPVLVIRFWGPISGFFKTLWNAVSSVVSTSISAIKTTINALQTAWTVSFNAVKTVTTAVWGFIKPILYAVIQIGILPIRLTIEALQIAWKLAWNLITTAASGAWNLIRPVLGFIVNLGIAVVKREIQALQTTWNTVWGAVASIVSTAWGVLSPILSKIINLGINVVEAAALDFSTTWSTIWGAVQTAVSDAWNFVQPIISKISDAVGGVAGAVGKVAGIAGKVGGAAGHVASWIGADGGWTPGAVGQAIAGATVHGGEYMLSNGMLTGRQRIDPTVLAAIGSNAARGASGGSSMTPLSGGGSGATSPQVVEIHTHIHMDGTEIAKTVTKHQMQRGQRNGITYPIARRA